jgi:hypothetical protein
MEIHDVYIYICIYVYVFKADYAHFECGSVAHPEGLLATQLHARYALLRMLRGQKVRRGMAVVETYPIGLLIEVIPQYIDGANSH